MLQVTFNLVCRDWRFLDIYLRLSFRREGRIDWLFFFSYWAWTFSFIQICQRRFVQIQYQPTSGGHAQSFRSSISPSSSWQRSPGQLPRPCRKLPKNCDNLSLCRFPIYRYVAGTMSKKLIDTLSCYNIYFQIQSSEYVEIFKHV